MYDYATGLALKKQSSKPSKPICYIFVKLADMNGNNKPINCYVNATNENVLRLFVFAAWLSYRDVSGNDPEVLEIVLKKIIHICSSANTFCHFPVRKTLPQRRLKRLTLGSNTTEYFKDLSLPLLLEKHNLRHPVIVRGFSVMCLQALECGLTGGWAVSSYSSFLNPPLVQLLTHTYLFLHPWMHWHSH